MHVIKTIKFDLPIDGVKVKNIEELRDHFSTEILELYRNGLLLKWLESRQLLDIYKKIENLPKIESQLELMQALCKIFDVAVDDAVIAITLSDGQEKKNKNIDELREHLKLEIKEEIRLEQEKTPIIELGKYKVYKNDTVLDIESNLMWKRLPEEEKYTWNDAIKKFNSVSFAEYSDWRLPNIDELKTLLVSGNSDAINQEVFSGYPNGHGSFWSSSVGHFSFQALNINFDYRKDPVCCGSKEAQAYIRLVRGNEIQKALDAKSESDHAVDKVSMLASIFIGALKDISNKRM